MAAAGLLAAVWWRLPSGAPPVYDGLCVANPYAYLNPPAGAPAQKPSSARHAVAVQAGSVPQVLVTTGEFPGQAQLSTDDGSVIPAAGATSIVLTIDPVPPPPILPQDGQVDGNVYRFAATGDNGAPASLNPAKPVTITLRPTIVNARIETIERLDGDHWTPLTTSLGSCSIYLSANTTALGTFVLVKNAATASGGPNPIDNGSPAASPFSPIGVLVAVILLLGVAFALLRFSRTRGARRRQTKPPPPGNP